VSYTGARRHKVNREEIERRFADAGWELDGSFSEHLVIGCSEDTVSLLAHQEVWGEDDSIFEILDHDQMLNSWVREIPTPSTPRNSYASYEKMASPQGVEPFLEEGLANSGGAYLPTRIR
jgi:hypothetical protein